MSAVYFMRPVGAAGPVKVGFSHQPAARLATYQAWSPVPLEIIATLEVKDTSNRLRGRSQVQMVERRFHERYLPWHLHHEWFQHNPLMAADIAAIEGGVFDLSVLPDATMNTWRLPGFAEATKAAA